MGKKKNNISYKVRLLIFKENRILLLHQTKKNGGNLTLVGGTVEANETPRRCLIRESIEEAGIILKPENLKLVHVLHKTTGKKRRVTLYFSTDHWDGFPHSREPQKFKRAAWYDYLNLPAKLTGTVRHVIQEVQSKKLYSEFKK